MSTKGNLICVVVLAGYMPAGPTIFTKLHHVVAMAAALITFTQLQSIPWSVQMAAPTVAICISLSYGLVPVSRVPTMHAHGATL